MTKVAIGDTVIVTQEYANWHTRYHNAECGIRLHGKQQTRPPIVGERLKVNAMWLAEGYPVELVDEAGYVFRASITQLQEMDKAYKVSRGWIFYGEYVLKKGEE